MRSELQRIVILPLILWSHIGMCSSAKNPLDRLRDKIPVNPVVKVAPTQLAGQYTSTSEKLRRHVGPFLSGSDLYLFPDGTYIYCEWADIERHNTRQRNMGVGGGTRGATVGPRGDLEPKRPAKIRVSAPVDPSKGDSSSWDRAGSPILRKAGG